MDINPATVNYVAITSSITRYTRQGNGTGKVRIITEGNACWIASGDSTVTAASGGIGFYMPAEAWIDARLTGTHIAVQGASSVGRIWFAELDDQGY